MNKKIIPIFVVSIVLVTAIQIFYCDLIYHANFNPSASYDVVLVYGGDLRRSIEGLSFANKDDIPIFISDSFNSPKDVEQKIGFSNVSITVDNFARTTDQNARNAAEFLKKKRFRKAVLVTNWYHIPRALFLTRFYLLGHDISVEPYFFEPIPSHWWIQSNVWLEIIKFWGSLIRVTLAFLGFQKAWFHS